jgi:hypothetical protein
LDKLDIRLIGINKYYTILPINLFLTQNTLQILSPTINAEALTGTSLSALFPIGETMFIYLLKSRATINKLNENK